ncbi:uncharacterized protein METZ01_LOCUS256163 [marine metagenome]|uniref:Thioredoxin domain-containing protein n=1 Tax=marine metagenome TaxID=408172 RepID=A0A382IVG7_9ZZZZ
MKLRNNSYIGISLIILIFGSIFIPKIIDRIQNNDIVRSDSRSSKIDHLITDSEPLAFLEIDGNKKKVPSFNFINQNGKRISNNDFLGKAYVIEFFFTTCTTICPIMNNNLIQIQNNLKNYKDFGIASFSINPEYDTVEILKKYETEYGITNQSWHLLTGDKEKIYDLANNGFNLYTASGNAFVDGFEHSGYFALIDKQGYIRCRIDELGNPKIYYRGYVDVKDKYDIDGEEEEISMLQEDLLKLINE